MIYHEMFGQHLRLGNFLFKYAWSVKMKSKYGIDTSYPDYYLWKYLENFPLISQEIKGPILRPLEWEYNEIEQNLLTNNILNLQDVTIALNYFFQSYKWFEGCEKEVCCSLKFKEEEIDKVKAKYSYIFDRHQPTIGISIRLGDFVGHGDFYQIPYDWYIKALKNIYHWKERKVIVFSDDIEKAKQIFKGFGFFYAEPNGTHTHADNFKHYHSEKAAEQFILGTMIDDWIIGNSTFSWWLAWISWMTNPLNRVIHSGKVFSKSGRMKHVDTTHYYHPDWEQI